MGNYRIDVRDTSPVVVGGLGGSGTRLVTRLLQDMNVSMGGHLNGTLDNLWYSLLFVRRSILMKSDQDVARLMWLFNNAMRHGNSVPRQLQELAREACRHGRDPVLPLEVLEEACESLLAVSKVSCPAPLWGWKQPNTHVLIGKLNQYFPQMKYIYVARNGLDMAFSENQNQLKYFWGDLLLDGDVSPTPQNALRYWVACYQRLLTEAAQLDTRIHILNFDRLCEEPLSQLQRLRNFLNIDVDSIELNRIAKSVFIPKTIGRYREEDISNFDSGDIEFVRKMGFNVQL